MLATGLAALGIIAAFDDAAPEEGVPAAPRHDYPPMPARPFSVDDVFRMPR